MYVITSVHVIVAGVCKHAPCVLRICARVWLFFLTCTVVCVILNDTSNLYYILTAQTFYDVVCQGKTDEDNCIIT